MINNDKLSILAIEDEPDILDIISTTLNHQNDRYNIFTATTLDNAIVIVASKHIDLVICDFNMGDYCAVDVLQAFQKIKLDYPVVIFSGNSKEYLDRLFSSLDFNIIKVVEKPNFPRLNKVVYEYFKKQNCKKA